MAGGGAIAVIEEETPRALGFAMPPEWARHLRTFMAWPCRREAWGDAPALVRAKAAYARVAAAISEFEPVTMIARPQDAKEAKAACGARVEILALAIDDSWVRDSGPIFVTRRIGKSGEAAGIDWKFNAWGGKYVGFAEDDSLPARLLAELGISRIPASMVLEGGAIAVDGSGLLMTTEECLLNPNRNPDLARAEIEQRLSDFLGASRVLWLPFGLSDDETDGHVDNVAAFAAPRRVLLHAPRDRSSEDFARMQANERALREHDLEVVAVPAPQRGRAWNGRLLPASYLNFYIGNGAVFVPRFGDPLDREAADILSASFPGREIVPIAAGDIIAGGGGIHCITQQQPDPETRE